MSVSWVSKCESFGLCFILHFFNLVAGIMLVFLSYKGLLKCVTGSSQKKRSIYHLESDLGWLSEFVIKEMKFLPLALTTYIWKESVAQIHALAKLHCQLQIPAFTILCFTDSFFYNSVFYRFRFSQFRVLQIPAFTIPCFTDSGFYNSVFYRFLIQFLIPFLDSSFRVLQIAVDFLS